MMKQKNYLRCVGKILFAFSILTMSLIPINSTIANDVVPRLNVSIKKFKQELRCLELNIFHEARGESKEGKIAVANVTINRVKSKKFPNTICGVVKQPYQFSWVHMKEDAFYKIVNDKLIKKIAFETLISNTKDNTNGALYFHNKTVDNFNKKLTKVIGNHKFYK